MRRYKISLLIDRSNDWIHPYARRLFSKLKCKGHNVRLYYHHKDVGKGDFLFMLGYTSVVPERYLRKNKHNLVVHESNLPQGRGWSPITWQILEGKKRIPVVLFEAGGKADTGEVFLKDRINLSGFELNSAIRVKQGNKTVDLIVKFVNGYYRLKSKLQKGKVTYYKKRNKQHSRLDVNKNLAEQFNLLRVVDNERYHAFFDYKGHRYILKIYNGGNYLKRTKRAKAAK